MEVLILSSGIIFVYSLFWLILSNKNSNNLDWDKTIKKISNESNDKSNNSGMV